MNNKLLIKIARKITSSFELDARKYMIQGKDENSFLLLRFNSQIWQEIGKTPEWYEITSAINPECQGRYYQIDQSCIEKMANGYDFIELKFNGVNDRNHKSPVMMFKYNLKQLGFIESKI